MIDPVSPRTPAGAPAFAPTIGLREVLEAAPDLIFCCDATGRFAWASSTFEYFAGWRASELVGRYFTELLPADERARVARFFMRQLRRSRRQSAGDFTLLCRDGSRADITARVRLYERPDGEAYFVGVARERVALPPAPGPDAERAAADVALLEARLRELQAQLAEAREGERLKADVLATMSQEIRPPMDAVIGAAATLLETSLSVEQRRLVEVIRAASHSLLSLVGDAHDHAQIEAGRMAIADIGFDLRVTAEQVAAVLTPLAQGQGVAFAWHVDPLLPSRLTGDPGRLRQVLLSLATGAIRGVERGTIALRMTREGEDDGHVTVLFEVQDPAQGVGAERRARIFRESPAGMTGGERQWGSAELALSIARRLVLLMGGLVGAESAPDGGVAYWFRITFAKQPPAVATPAADVRLRGVRVLVADQLAGERGVHAGTLAAWGCEVEEAENGIEALERVRAAATVGRPFALALVDMALEGLDGESVAAAVRADPALASTRLVLTTRVGRPGDALRARDLGCAAYLVKPLDASQLFDALVELLAGPEPPAAATERTLVTRHSLAEARRTRVRVLLVEDDAVNQLVTTSALNRVGFQVEVAATGRAAIAATEAAHWDLVLMNLQMPDLDGLQATAAIRARERGAWRTPILGMSAATDLEAERVRCAAGGLDDVLAKPLDLPSLAETVERWTLRPDARAEDDAGRRERPAAPAVVADALEPVAREPEPEVPALDDGPALDLEQLNIASMGLPSLRQSMLDTYLGDVFPRLQRLETAIEARDLALVQREAHALRGMCATVGAGNCTILFGEIERWAGEGHGSGLARLLALAVGEVRRTEEFASRLEHILARDAA